MMNSKYSGLRPRYIHYYTTSTVTDFEIYLGIRSACQGSVQLIPVSGHYKYTTARPSRYWSVSTQYSVMVGIKSYGTLWVKRSPLYSRREQ